MAGRTKPFLSAALFVAGCVLAMPSVVPAADATTPCSTVLVPGSDWLGASGVDVHSNGSDQGTGYSCAGESASDPAVQDGYGWQCVELAARLYAVKGWGSVHTANGAAYTIPEGSPGLTFHPNGSGYVPVPGDLIVENQSPSEPDGHVAVVDYISGSTIHTVEQNAVDGDTGRHNYTLSGSTITGSWSSNGVRGVEHSPSNPNTNSGSGDLGEGSFVSNDGFVYRIAGGAPIYVSNWNAVGGPQPSVALSDAEFAALPQYPREGTFLNSSTGAVYRVAGGAPLFVSSWNAVGGPQSYVTVDQAAIDNAGGGVPWSHLRPYPADGTFLNSSTGAVYRVAGGAPLFVSSWNAVGGPQLYVTVDQWDLENISNPAAHLRQYPADGTFLNSSTGAVYRVAGGAPLFVSKWSAVGGEQPYVDIDNWDIENIGNPAAHLNGIPANGTFLNSSTGAVYRVVGGAPLFVSNWNAVGGSQPYVTVDQWDLENISNPAAHLNPVPADGTFLNTSTGHVYRIAGGAPFAVSSWNVFGGEQPYITVDEWDLEHIANPAAHLNERPANGTIVEGLPSDTYWSFSAGLRTQVSSAPGATTVDDFGLSAFPKPTPPLGPVTTHTETPSATPNSLGQPKGTTSSLSATPAHGVLGTSAHAAPKKASFALSRALAKCRKIRSHRNRAKCETAAKRRYRAAQKKTS